MGDHTSIEWTDATWNPVVGCAHVSPGCDNCYAAREASGRLRGVPVYAGLAEAGRFTGEVRCLPERLDQPLRWRKPRLVFVNSMSDLFHRDIAPEFIAQVWETMGSAAQHTFQVLTKRPQRMAQVVQRLADGHYTDDDGIVDVHPGAVDAVIDNWPLPNVWLGTSIESDRYAFRADHLRATPAAVRFLSLEPLLGPLPSLDLTGIDWVIVGGESGPRARPMHPAWARDIRDRCIAAGVPFLFKQWGEWATSEQCGRLNGKQTANRWQYETHRFAPDGTDYRANEPDLYLYPGMETVMRVGKKAAGRVLDGRTWDEMPAPAGAEGADRG